MDTTRQLKAEKNQSSNDEPKNSTKIVFVLLNLKKNIDHTLPVNKSKRSILNHPIPRNFDYAEAPVFESDTDYENYLKTYFYHDGLISKHQLRPHGGKSRRRYRNRPRRRYRRRRPDATKCRRKIYFRTRRNFRHHNEEPYTKFVRDPSVDQDNYQAFNNQSTSSTKNDVFVVYPEEVLTSDNLPSGKNVLIDDKSVVGDIGSISSYQSKLKSGKQDSKLWKQELSVNEFKPNSNFEQPKNYWRHESLGKTLNMRQDNLYDFLHKSFQLDGPITSETLLKLQVVKQLLEAIQNAYLNQNRHITSKYNIDDDWIPITPSLNTIGSSTKDLNIENKVNDGFLQPKYGFNDEYYPDKLHGPGPSYINDNLSASSDMGGYSRPAYHLYPPNNWYLLQNYHTLPKYVFSTQPEDIVGSYPVFGHMLVQDEFPESQNIKNGGKLQHLDNVLYNAHDSIINTRKTAAQVDQNDLDSKILHFKLSPNIINNMFDKYSVQHPSVLKNLNFVKNSPQEINNLADFENIDHNQWKYYTSSFIPGTHHNLRQVNNQYNNLPRFEYVPTNVNGFKPNPKRQYTKTQHQPSWSQDFNKFVQNQQQKLAEDDFVYHKNHKYLFQPVQKPVAPPKHQKFGQNLFKPFFKHIPKYEMFEPVPGQILRPPKFKPIPTKGPLLVEEKDSDLRKLNMYLSFVRPYDDKKMELNSMEYFVKNKNFGRRFDEEDVRQHFKPVWWTDETKLLDNIFKTKALRLEQELDDRSMKENQFFINGTYNFIPPNDNQKTPKSILGMAKIHSADNRLNTMSIDKLGNMKNSNPRSNDTIAASSNSKANSKFVKVGHIVLANSHNFIVESKLLDDILKMKEKQDPKAINENQFFNNSTALNGTYKYIPLIGNQETSKPILGAAKINSEYDSWNIRSINKLNNVKNSNPKSNNTIAASSNSKANSTLVKIEHAVLVNGGNFTIKKKNMNNKLETNKLTKLETLVTADRSISKTGGVDNLQITNVVSTNPAIGNGMIAKASSMSLDHSSKAGNK